jgi:RecA/RadA recombinase
MASLADRLLKKGSIDSASMLKKSEFFGKKETVVTDVPVINLALSGFLNEGFGAGLTTLAGPSKHFKSALGLLLCAAYQKKYDDGVILFYDSEFGTTLDYFEAAGIDGDRVIHLPIRNIEELKFDIMQKLEEIKKGDHVFIFVDSVGNLASKKEVDDALNEKAVADMTRAKQLKSVFRMVTPYLTMANIPMCVIAHTYDEIGMFPKTVIGGGTGLVYSSNSAFIIGRRQVKDGTEIQGWEFVLNVEKSRFLREKSAIPFTVTYEGGIEKYSGLLDIAKASGWVVSEKQGWYSRPSVEDDKNWRRKDTNSDDFWMPLLENPDFHNAIHDMYKLGSPIAAHSAIVEVLVDTSVDEDGEIL